MKQEGILSQFVVKKQKCSYHLFSLDLCCRCWVMTHLCLIRRWRENQTNPPLTRQRQLSTGCRSLSSIYTLCFRLFLIKTTVVAGAPRFSRCRSIRDHISVSLPAPQHQTRHLSTGLGSARATAGASTPRPAPEIDGQLKSERRRLERVMCENPSNMQNEFSLHLPGARERERRRGGDVWSVCWKQREQDRCIAETNAHTKKLLIFYVVLVSWRPCTGFHKWPLIRLRRTEEKHKHIMCLAPFCFPEKEVRRFVASEKQAGKKSEPKLFCLLTRNVVLRNNLDSN